MKLLKTFFKVFLLIFLCVALYMTYSYNTPGNLKSSSFLNEEIEKIVHLKSKHHVLNKEVSSADISWHLDHMLLVINRIYEALEKSDPSAYESGFNLPRIIMFSTKYIPRGRAKSPNVVRPKDTITLAVIEDHLKSAQLNLQKFDALPEKSNFVHPFIGQLNREGAKRFIKIHTQHHLKICNDILKASK